VLLRGAFGGMGVYLRVAQRVIVANGLNLAAKISGCD